MASPSWYFDGDKLRIYEVPPSPSFTVDGDGFRIYTTSNPGAYATVTSDIQKDLWSRWVDWILENDWSQIAFSRSGGDLRGFDSLGNPVYQSVDFKLRTDLGWRIVLANYPHENIMTGNLYATDTASLFDTSRLTAQGVVPRLSGSADLLVYQTTTGGSTYTPAQIATAVRQELDVEMTRINTHLTDAKFTMLMELYDLMGLDPTKPLVVTNTSRTAGAISQTIVTNTNQTTMTRSV